jgi:hypothetical protein
MKALNANLLALVDRAVKTAYHHTLRPIRARTLKGRIHYAYVNRNPRHRVVRWPYNVGQRPGVRDYTDSRTYGLTQEDRDFRRAKKDKVFRRKFKTRLRREVKALTREFASDNLDKAVQLAEEFTKNDTRLTRLYNMWSVLGKGAVTHKNVATIARIPFGRKADERVYLRRDIGLQIEGRGNVYLRTTASETYTTSRRHQSVYRYGRWRTIQNAEHNHFIRSLAIITRDKTRVKWRLHDQSLEITAPEGTSWRRDHHGIALVRGQDEYHPMAFELYAASKGDWSHILREMDDNARLRQQELAENMVLAAEAEGVWVCLQDSLSAGNCLAGTLSWAEQQGIKPGRHYAATELLKCVKTDAGRVRLALSHAIRRHKREMEQGYANLAEHVVA